MAVLDVPWQLPFATIPATPHYPEFTDRYAPQNDRLLFPLQFMTNGFFQLSSPHFYLVSQSYDQSNLVYSTTPDRTDKVLVPNCSPKPHLSSAIHLI